MADKKEYIERGALRDRMFNYYSIVNENTSKENYRGETLMAYEVADMIEDCIDNAPAADVVEVRHGEWRFKEYGEDTYTNLTRVYECSLCGRTIERLNEADEPYCHCGAKTDGERKEQT